MSGTSFAVDLNNNDECVSALRTGDGEFTIVTPVAGVFLGTGPALWLAGDATGFDPASTWDEPNTELGLKINDNRQVLIAHSVTDSGGSRRVIALLDVNASGIVTGETIVAEVGGDAPGAGACPCDLTGDGDVSVLDLLDFLALWFPQDPAADFNDDTIVNVLDLLDFLACWFPASSGACGGGAPDTWASLASGSDAIALNDGGTVAFSGTTVNGSDGIFVWSAGDGDFLVSAGDASPVGGQTWGSLLGAPVDLNGSGEVAFRGALSSGSTWTELGEAGEDASQGGDGNETIGSGPLLSISGTLLDDHDVDVYRIRVRNTFDFGATLVGSPDAFDSVLHLTRTFFNSSAAFRVGVARNDDTSDVEPHATLTNEQVFETVDYYICVSTSKARLLASNGSEALDELWVRDPASVTIDPATNTLYWPDPSEGVIRTASTAGVAGPDLVVSTVPSVFRGLDGLLGLPIALHSDGASSKVYFIERNEFRMKRANLDGSGIEDVFLDAANPAQGSATQIAIDTTTSPAMLWWAAPAAGGATVTIWRSELDGSSFDPIVPSVVVGNAVGLAPDGANDRVFFSTEAGDIKVAALPIINGTEITDFANGAGARDLAIDTAAGELYWTRIADGSVMKADLDGVNAGVATPVLGAGQAPEATGIATAGGVIYWTDVSDRSINRVNPDGTMASEVFDMGADTGSRTSDGNDLGAGGVGPFAKQGVAGGGPFSYTLSLSGCDFFFEPSVLSVNNATLVAQTGQTLPAISPTIIDEISATVRISDDGDVLWVADFGADEAVFLDQSVVFDETTPVGFTVTGIEADGRCLDLSDNGRFGLIRVFDGTPGDIGGGGGGGNGVIELDFGP